jgi:cobalt/nickel transport system permease protein
MHLSEGILSAPVLISGAAIATAGIAIGLKKMDNAHVPEVAVMSSTFFVASLVHLPVGPVSIHLSLIGLMGLVLGWTVFPAVFVALTFQALLFQFGGFTTLGINTAIMATPALIIHYVFTAELMRKHTAIIGFLAGALGAILASIMLAGSLAFTGEAFSTLSKAVFISQAPAAILEGIVTAIILSFILKVKPEILLRTAGHA